MTINYHVRIMPFVSDDEFDSLLAPFGAEVIRGRDDYHNIQTVAIPEERESACSEFLEAHDYIMWAQKCNKPKLCYMPNNYLYPITNQSFFETWGIEQAWGLTTGGAPIALIDDSVDGSHPDFSLKGNKLIAGNSGALVNSGGHGTYTGGACAAPFGSAAGVPGISGDSPLTVYSLGASLVNGAIHVNSTPDTVMDSITANARLTGDISAKIISMSIGSAAVAYPGAVVVLNSTQIQIIGNITSTLAGSSARVATANDGSVRAKRILLGSTQISGSDTIANYTNLDGDITGCTYIYLPDKALDTKCQTAAVYNIIMVVAAGNDTTTVGYNPYAIPYNCICVSATDGGNTLYTYPVLGAGVANAFGSTASLSAVAGYATCGSNVDVFAPANDIAVQQSKGNIEAAQAYFAMSFPLALTAGSTAAVTTALLTGNSKYPGMGAFRPFDANPTYLSNYTYLAPSSVIAPGQNNPPIGTVFTLSQPALATGNVTLTIANGVCGFYAGVSGTSLSTPRVAGIIALMHTLNPNMTIEQTRAALIATSQPVSGNHAAGCAMPYAALTYNGSSVLNASIVASGGNVEGGSSIVTKGISVASSGGEVASGGTIIGTLNGVHYVTVNSAGGGIEGGTSGVGGYTQQIRAPALGFINGLQIQGANGAVYTFKTINF